MTSWHEKYWDAIDQLYWNPSLLGLSSISRKEWIRADGTITIPSKHVQNSGSIYARKGTALENEQRVRRLEEPLNHIFEIAFGIAAASAITRLLAGPLGFEDPGPYERLGRDVGWRYPDWLDTGVTQQDGFFVSSRSLIGVELKVASKTWPGQVLKYIALMAGEQRLSGRRDQLGLLFITPSPEGEAIYSQARLRADGSVPPDFPDRVPDRELNTRLRQLLAEFPGEFDDVINRLRVEHVSWTTFVEQIRRFAAPLKVTEPGDETLHRLMSGLADAIEAHIGCIPPAINEVEG